jgi:hypothetical protein
VRGSIDAIRTAHRDFVCLDRGDHPPMIRAITPCPARRPTAARAMDAIAFSPTAATVSRIRSA